MNFTKRQVLQDAYEQLRKSGANVIGTVASCVKEIGSSSYYKYYSGYSKGNPATSGDAASRFSLDKIEHTAKVDAADDPGQAAASAEPAADTQANAAPEGETGSSAAEATSTHDATADADGQKPADAQTAAAGTETQDEQQRDAAPSTDDSPIAAVQVADPAPADQPADTAASLADAVESTATPQEEPTKNADKATAIATSPATKPKKLFSSARKDDDSNALHAIARHSKPIHTKKKR